MYVRIQLSTMHVYLLQVYVCIACNKHVQYMEKLINYYM